MTLEYLPIGIFAAVYTLIVLRNLRWFRIPVWTIMMAGAVAMIFSGAIPLKDAYASINLNVIFFLLGMFSVVAALDLSGLLEYLTLRLLRLAKSPQKIFGLALIGTSAMSAFLVNDTLALMATPIMLSVAKQLRVRPGVFLITLALGVTIGSTMTAIGNPQNLLVALSTGIPNPMLDFLYYLAPPTMAGLGVTYLILRWYYRKEFSNSTLAQLQANPRDAIKDQTLAKLSGSAAGIVVIGFFLVGIAELFGVQGNFNLGTVSLLGATIVFLGSGRRREILRSVDWGIIIFFISLFIVMQAFWESNALQSFMIYLPVLTKSDPGLSIITIILASAFFSQLLSNVPFVAVYIKAMQAAGFTGADVKPWMALAGASTLSGGISLLGAASNVIILEQAESRGSGFGFLEFSKIGLLVTIPNLLILYLFLRVL
ncbi:MAG TPA: SLC13 family permease [Candidatus Bathyarchaeia archaeon]|nr:SLC13 family permease [Candidatus Bathyarchaeia archaeon]